ncbi:hypothetical protein Hypma_000389 [Hypsizygus marmoreus]|uniref:Uncharacterized protein n=1 Tax=Hypsizygus marmoreus TaxID=39966 RepID=A0A369J922_HYPMA|nr:hypothetical protein Hypma_000389 [Hypsizygus marmoreus]
MTDLSEPSRYLPSVPLPGHATPADFLAQFESHARDANVLWDTSSDSDLERLRAAAEQRQEAKDHLKGRNYEGILSCQGRFICC